jgi:hypothetical protein
MPEIHIYFSHWILKGIKEIVYIPFRPNKLLASVFAYVWERDLHIGYMMFSLNILTPSC